MDSDDSAAQPWPGGTVLNNVPYSDDANDAHRQLDLYMPATRTSTRPPTLLVYVHGGLWMDRDKKEYQHVGRCYTTHGLTVAVVNYRQTQHKAKPPAEQAAADTQAVEAEEDMSLVVRHPTHTLDLAAALTFLTSDCSFSLIPTDAYDRRRVVVFGHSCGAHMMALLVSNPSLALAPATLSSVIGCVGCEGLYAVAQYAASPPRLVRRPLPRLPNIRRPHQPATPAMGAGSVAGVAQQGRRVGGEAAGGGVGAVGG